MTSPSLKEGPTTPVSSAFFWAAAGAAIASAASALAAILQRCLLANENMKGLLLAFRPSPRHAPDEPSVSNRTGPAKHAWALCPPARRSGRFGTARLPLGNGDPSLN